ncbi:MAG: hypothetical protein ACRC33_03540, partial [Gemmataceae bacterium]
EEVLTAGMYRVGGVYDFRSEHRSLRVEQERGKKWRPRTPATAAGWAGHVWSTREFLSSGCFAVEWGATLPPPGS